jgi:Nucleotidyl transferase AbiEii toxin, Type IV TA system
MPEQLKEPECRVRTLTAERTFWEKATLLHALCHKPLEKPLDNWMSRHYYDVAKLYRSPFGPKDLTDRGLLEKVVDHKNSYGTLSITVPMLLTPHSSKILPIH